MNMLLSRSSTFGLLLLALFLPSTQSSADGQERLAATIAQDEPRTIPEDNIAYFSRADRKVRFQLVKLSGSEEGAMAGTPLIAIDSAGVKTQLVTDKDGYATLENVTNGLHALVVAGEKGHLAVPVALREQVVENEPVKLTSPATVELAITGIEASDAAKFTTAYLPPTLDGSFEDIDSDLVATGNAAPSLRNRVRLSIDGVLSGQVSSLLREGLSTFGVGGTNIAIYRGNQLITRTVADEVGRFSVPAMAPGFYGIQAAGPAGYASFGFEAYDDTTIATSRGARETLVAARATTFASMAAQGDAGDVLPVVLIPPSLLPGVLEQIRVAGLPVSPDGFAAVPGLGPTVPGVTPGFGGLGAPGVGAGPGMGAGGGFGAAGGGLGGAGALGLLAAGGIAAAVIASDDDDQVDFLPPPVVSPATAD